MVKTVATLVCCVLALAIGINPSGAFFSWSDLSELDFKSSIRVGYQQTGFNMGLSTGKAAHMGTGSTELDLKFQGANTCVGAVELGADVQSNLYLFLRGEATASRGVDVLTEKNALVEWAIMGAPYQWQGSAMEWWAVDSGASYSFSQGISALAGFRVDHFSLKLRNPVDRDGKPINYVDTGPGEVGVATESETVLGDLQTKLWLPYLGLGIDSVNYRMSVIWSPIAWARVTLPLTDIYRYDERDYLLADLTNFRYRIFNPACLLEGTFEYDVAAFNTFGLQFWCRYSWLNTRGSGNVDAAGKWVEAGEGGSSRDETDNLSALATFRRHTLTLGLTALLAF